MRISVNINLPAEGDYAIIGTNGSSGGQTAMAAPEGYKTIEEIAVELKMPLGRVQAAINTLNIPQQSFPPDRRRRYYSPEAVRQITQWLSNK